MKKILFGIIALLSITLVSCEKESGEAPGNISGLGDNEGTLEVVENFELPEDIYISGDITGFEDSEESLAALKSAGAVSSYRHTRYGSGDQVKLKLTLLNTSSRNRTIVFPRGLVWECLTGGYQHGLQIQSVWISLKPNEKRAVNIDLYCANMTRPVPDRFGTYRILGVTSSSVLKRLLNYIGWRMVNYEMYEANNLKSATATPTYEEIVLQIQEIVHNLTDRGLDLTDEEIAFIESIPEIPEDQRPQVDEKGNYVEYFEEYGVAN
ncbi:hypothetical protein [Saccharicrinis sp. 156]|uniref:hypothetical protein n=1 Tax=Saccharicrinis sp. 156 TaxID=3417574 RepID=UPI003D357DC6